MARGRNQHHMELHIMNEVQNHIDATGSIRVIVIISSAMINAYEDTRRIQNSLWSTNVYLNEELLEIVNFRQRIACTARFDENAKIDVLQPHPKSGTIDDVITWHKNTIEELSTITIVKLCTFATIEALDPDFGWYYIVCRKCHKSVKEEAVPIAVVKIEGETSSKKSRSQIPSKTVFRCGTEGCPKPITTASPRYKMRLDVEDGTPGSCTFVMFDDCIRHLMNKSCKQIRETIPPIEDDNSITDLDTSDVAISQSVSSNIPKVTGSSSVGTKYDQDDESITPVSSIQKRKVVEIDVDDQEHQTSTNKKHV
ncbi:OLC1v1005740C1 [Oldenlandia corymbosa var. corymbosa]|uniref:OLC1v1005740C1 n=1 Tax=Oldenlandia corymbosa var. corymbosa TaxID=529605 RepID=A0AAV1DFS7_OLDCO|nr:OLC1v1005740C1 [Oldenlandia corymbosa var. corymbosa]